MGSVFSASREAQAAKAASGASGASGRLVADLPGSPPVLEVMATRNYLDLPRLPVPEVDATLERLLESCRACAASEEELAALVKAIGDFKSGPAEQLQAAVLKSAAGEGYPYSWLQGFWDEMYNGLRDPAPINVAPFFAIEDQGQGTLACARFALAFCKWSRKVLAGKLEPDAVPLDMTAMGKLFSSAKIPRKGRDELYQDATSTNLVIVSGGRIWSVEAFRDGKLLAPEALARAIEAARAAPAAPTCESLPILTADNRNVWATEREALLGSSEQNKASLGLVDKAIIVIAVDKVTEEGASAKARNFLLGDAASRWWDKHQIVLDAHGSFAVNFEHSYSDGTNWGRFIEECMKDATGAPSAPYTPLPSFDTFAEAEAAQLAFELPASTQRAIGESLRAYDRACSDVEVERLDYKGWGKAATKAWGLSPDAAVQLAFQLAYFRLYGRMGPTYESAQMRRFFAGRTETIRSCTLEARAMCQAWREGPGSASSLRAAAAKQSEVTKAAAAGRGIDRHLYALQQHAAALGLDVALFSDPLFVRSKGWVMSTSNGSAPFLSCFGFAPTHPQGHGMGYVIGTSGLSVCCSAFASATKGARAFQAELERALDDIKAACGQQPGQEAAKAPGAAHPSLLASERVAALKTAAA